MVWRGNMLLALIIFNERSLGLLNFIIFATGIDSLTNMDRRLYILPCLLAFLALGCEKADRAVSVFSGVEPIFEVGVCDNRVAAITLYLSRPDSVVLGIDGGDGDYQLSFSCEEVASADFVEDINGYRRFVVHPVDEGETVLFVSDGDGREAMVSISVREERTLKMLKFRDEYGITVGYSSVLDRVLDYIDDRSLLNQGGYYLMFPDTEVDDGWNLLEVYPTADTAEPLTGCYDMRQDDGNEPGHTWEFVLDDGEHRVFSSTLGGPSGDRIVLSEDVSYLCPPDLLPEGVVVVHRELLQVVDMPMPVD